jgi:hypothetical protein
MFTIISLLIGAFLDKLSIWIIELFAGIDWGPLVGRIRKETFGTPAHSGKSFDTLKQWFSNYVPRHNTVPWGNWKCAKKFQLNKGYI